MNLFNFGGCLHEWLTTALKRGAGQAHKWSNAPNALPALQLCFKRADGTVETDPIEVAAYHVRPWELEWEGNAGDAFGLEMTEVLNIRQQYLGTAEEWAENIDLSSANIRQTARAFPKKTAIGLDNIFFTDIALLPDNAINALGSILKQCLCSLALLVQTLLQLMVMLGKKNGGSRTIAILSTFYRLLMRILAPAITEWDLAKAGHWDSAVRGHSALRAHLARALDVELDHHEGKHVLHFLWDMRKFYDSIRVTKLIPQLVKHGYPAHVLTLGLLAHKAPRTFKVGSSFSMPVCDCTRIILAGCQQSVSWARGLLYELVESLGYVLPNYVCHEHVDDLSHEMASKSKVFL